MMIKMQGLIIFFFLSGGILKAHESPEIWIGEWVKGIEFAKDFRNYSKALIAYTAAIDGISAKEKLVQLSLINERGNVSFKMLNFNDAINDFSYVLNHSQASEEQIVEALWGRCKAYLGSGKIPEFEKDSAQLNQLIYFVNRWVECKAYSVQKINPYVFREETGKQSFIKLLLIRKEINSEKDVIFTPSGLVIIKKVEKI